ncbi:UDP-N-acetylglucosamine 2-epimerase (non-hydrolyzing) [Aeromonas veronii]|jgi:UDP-N-acetylglucosamine 2-epimerase (non-hydrolysing)|uniref:non-hydrolyzing UDP-N-acetylglucosamine 2-epimerase n=1 Tax=Aeromonas veronii TaxID=654 RepID=UPI00341E01A4
MTKTYKIDVICGTRPNFVKVARLISEFDKCDFFETRLIHTGQHYDKNLNEIFFEQLNIRTPDYYLDVCQKSPTFQLADITAKYAGLIIESRPDATIVIGDVTSTLACAIAAKYNNIPVIHLEAGLRCGSNFMLEEINRKMVDSISDVLLTPSEDASSNLINEGVCHTKIFHVGNIMIDSLLYAVNKYKSDCTLNDLNIQEKKYIVVTVHRQQNLNAKSLNEITQMILNLSDNYTVVFPVHPHTLKHLKEERQTIHNKRNIKITPPLGYNEFTHLLNNARAVITDSGGIQEETTFLGVPCFTIRDSTERPITIKSGTNIIAKPFEITSKIIEAQYKKFTKERPTIAYWDGETSFRILQIVKDFLHVK